MSKERINILGVGVNDIDLSGAIEQLISSVSSGERGYVCVTGAHGVLESQRDPELRVIHNNSLLTVPDGVPNVWIGKLHGHRSIDRVYGPDLMLHICRRSVESGFTHFLYGSDDDTLERVKSVLVNRFPGICIVGTYAPPYRPLGSEEEHELQRMVAACKPDFFWVGLSTPKQEIFMARHAPEVNGQRVEARGMRDAKPAEVTKAEGVMRGRGKRSELLETDRGPRGTDNIPHVPYTLEVGIMIGVGAAFDYHAGRLTEPPCWVKKIGLQWFYRLCREPRRLWMRYLWIVPTFIWLNLLQSMGLKKFPMDE